MLQRGFTFVFLTFTAAHEDAGASLFDFILRFNAALRHMKSGKRWQTFSKKWDFRHSIKTVETTDDAPHIPAKVRSGWHYHSHILAFLERPPLSKAEAAEMESKLAKMWLDSLAGVALQASREHGCRLDMPRTKFDGTIDNSESLKKLARYVTKTVGFEMTGYSKSGKTSRRITIWELQSLALTTNQELLSRYADYVRAIMGVHFIQWSPGLKQFTGIKEVADSDIMRGEAETHLCYIEDEDMAKVAKQGGQKKLLVRAACEGDAGIRAGLRAARLECDIETGEFLIPP